MNMKTCFCNLEAALKSNNIEDVKVYLQSIKLHSETVQLSNAELPIIHSLLKHSSTEVLTYAAESIADIAKATHNRGILSTPETVSCLLALLDYEDCALSIQACRSLGNVCYENASGRKIVGKNGFKKLVSSIIQNKVFKNVKLDTVSFGFMLNLLMENEELWEAVVEEDILGLIETALRDQGKELYEDYTLHLLSVLSLILEYTSDDFLPDGLCLLLIGLLRSCNNTQIVYYCLEILHGHAEKEGTKFFLAKEGVCELVISLIEKYKNLVDDEETKTALRMACDIIVLVLTDDKPMVLLYKRGEGAVYKNMLEWMNSDDIDLSSTGILAIGNFARNDAHCVEMVRNGISKQLLELLPDPGVFMSSEELKLQHAILCALRNLVILPENKVKMIEEGAICSLYPIVSSTYTPVIFKLLGTLRIITDGQEEAALNLVMQRDLLERVAKHYFQSDHLGVRGEACRLLAWLIRNCHSSKPYHLIVDIEDCVKCLVQMLASNHAIMQNEAVFALNMITLSCVNAKLDDTYNSDTILNRKFDKALVDADIAQSYKFVINKYKDKFERETLSNLLTLLKNVAQFRGVSQHLQQSNVTDCLLSLQEQKYCDLNDKLETLLNTINSG